MTTSPPPAEDDRLRPGATLTLTLVTVVSGAGLGRLFEDASFFLPVTVVGLTGHLLAALLRRVGAGAGAASLVFVGGGALVLGLVHAPSSTNVGLPSGATWRIVSDDLSEAWRLFGDVSAPAPTAAGFVLAAAAAAWVVAWTSDALAFRAGAPVEALAPATGLFLFGSVLAEDLHRLLTATAFVGAALLFVLVERTTRPERRARWIRADGGRGARSTMRLGLGLATAALVVGAVLAPVLPGSDSAAIVDLDPDGGGGGDRVTLSPLVDIRSRLVDQADVEVFTVRSDQRSYWRLTALDEFDGTIWSSRGTYESASGSLAPPPGTDDTLAAGTTTQEFTIGALSAIWLPAAYRPVEVRADVDVRHEPDTATLTVDTDVDNSDALTYQVDSAIPSVEAAQLADATGPDAEFDDRYTSLPGGFPRYARRIAREATAGASGDYEVARALQDFFRDEFEYSLEVPPGHGALDIASFLNPDNGRVGYCEQFSGAYASMARSLGLPARVAVGFTPGTADADDPGVFRVRGEHAHAWPEVYFDGVGWVGFEPTPGRGAPGAEEHTGVPEQQAAPGEADAVVTPTTTVTPSTTAPAPAPAGALPDPVDPPESTSNDDVGLLRRGPLRLLALALALPLLGLVVLWTVARVRRAVRDRQHQHDPRARAGDVWEDAVRSLRAVGLRPDPAETPREFANRAAAATGLDASGPERLADLVTEARYAAAPPGESRLRDVELVATELDERATRIAGRARRTLVTLRA